MVSDIYGLKQEPERSGAKLRMSLLIGAVLIGLAVGYIGVKKLFQSDPIANNDGLNLGNTKTGSDKIAPNENYSGPLFEEVSAEVTGVNFIQRLVPNHPKAYLYHSGSVCGGVCLGDVNGDGLCDIFLASGPDDNALFLNKGDFVFEKSSASRELSGFGNWAIGSALVDVDGDGDLDIFVCNYDAPNLLWLNEGTDSKGQLHFKECGSAAGLDYAGPSFSPYFSDFDGDGDLDFFLLTNRLYSPTGRPRKVASELGPDKKPRIKKQFSPYLRVVTPSVDFPGRDNTTAKPYKPKSFMLEYGHEDRLYRNDGPNSNGIPQFKDVTAASGIGSIPGLGLSALIWDVNHDGRPDIYVANDMTDPDRLWINEGIGKNGEFRFRDATREYVPYTTWSSMGSDVADVDGDGRLDFMVCDMAATTHVKAKTTMGEMRGFRRWVLENSWPRQAMRNMLFVDSGAGRFQEVAFMADVARSDWTWAIKFADFDLDGRNDLFLTNGMVRTFTDSDFVLDPLEMVGQTEWEIFRNKPEMHEKNIAFRNLGGLRFDDVSRSWNLDKNGMSYGAATGDLDNDGDLDLIVCNLNEPVSIYRNHAAEDGKHWLRVRLEGTGGNRFGVGAMVTAKLADGSSLVRLMNPQTGFLSGNEPILHFGLGSAKEIEKLIIRWPNGTVQTLGPQDANQLIVARQADDSDQPRPPVKSMPPKFAEVADHIGLRFKHREIPFNDYRREFLLPGKLSQFGPGVAVADINGDGLDDVFVGGAAGQSGVLFVHQLDHTFAAMSNPPWAAHAESEDMGLLFFDANRDGKLDLYVVHGSNQWKAADKRYADRLYLNQSKPDGPVVFVESKAGAIPEMRFSGSCVVAADFDRDGDLDLFVGARSVPGQYPLTPNSTLLRNDSQPSGEVKFTDVTDSVAPEMRQAGLVTGALWSDADRDGWPDLLVSCEWGPIRIFMNRKGQLEDATDSTGLGARLGWWNSITGADFDGDGDIDYAVFNVGLNTKYGRATAKKPAILYRGDMDGNGVFDLVEAKTSSQGELPVRGRSCSCNAMPLLRKKFPTFKGFALSSLQGVYSDELLKSALKMTATNFESGVWVNESQPGKPHFAWQSLPIETQISPCFGSVATDFFGDGQPSLAVVQNLFSREPETGLWRGGLGCFLRPTENGPLTTMGNDKSGFVVAGDGKGLAIVDLDADGRPDLLAAQNDDRLLAFKQTSNSQKIDTIAVRLEGPAGNRLGFGALIQLMADGKSRGVVEVFGGSGYLSQSTSVAYFARPSAKSVTINVKWPDGTESSVAVRPDQNLIRMAK